MLRFLACAVLLAALATATPVRAQARDIGQVFRDFESICFTFAEAGKFDEVIVSLAILNDAPTEMMARLLEGPHADLILIPCRSARLNWPSVEAILRNRPMSAPINEQTLALAQRDYRKLSMETAQRTVRFWQLHNKIGK